MWADGIHSQAGAIGGAAGLSVLNAEAVDRDVLVAAAVVYGARQGAALAISAVIEYLEGLPADQSWDPEILIKASIAWCEAWRTQVELQWH